jgi:dTDP-4-dehydrorhamnose reductase
MNPRRALITGVGGFLGSALAAHLDRQGWTVWGSWRSKDPALKGVQARQLDICQADAFRALVAEAKPDVLYHLAAVADPDACAADPATARQINVQGARIAALAAAEAGARLVFVSTDQVVDGSHPLWREEEPMNPLGVYGRSKLDAENEILTAASGEALIFRLALTYGWSRGGARGRNFAEKWLRTLLTGGKILAFTDQWRTPIYGEDACEALRLGAVEGWKGMIHLAGPERLTRHDFGTRMAAEFSFPTACVEAASLKDTVFPDPRPADASLDTSRLRALGFSPRAVGVGLKAMHMDLQYL